MIDAETIRHYEWMAEGVRAAEEFAEVREAKAVHRSSADTRKKADALAAIIIERRRQDQMWGDQWSEGLISPEMKLAILMEEVGEVAREILDAPKDKPESEKLRTELVQVAAIAVAFLESLPSEEGENG